MTSVSDMPEDKGGALPLSGSVLRPSGGAAKASPAEPLVPNAGLAPFQRGVDAWMDACFGDEIKADVQERCDRFVEESLEFVQAAGYSAERAHALVDYTFGRPLGEINQEVGGVMVTLAAMCNTLRIDIGDAAETELARVWTKIDKIRAKQAGKPTGSALPIAIAIEAAAAGETVKHGSTRSAKVRAEGIALTPGNPS